MTMRAVLFLNGQGHSTSLDFHMFKHFVGTVLASTLAPTFSQEVVQCIANLAALANKAEAWVAAGNDLDPDSFIEEEFEGNDDVPKTVGIKAKVLVELLGIALDRLHRVYGEFREDVRAALHRAEFVEEVNTREILFYTELISALTTANNQAEEQRVESLRPQDEDEIPRSPLRFHSITVSVEDV